MQKWGSSLTFHKETLHSQKKNICGTTGAESHEFFFIHTQLRCFV